MAQTLQQQLKEVGSKLETPPSTKDALIKLLKQAVSCLSELDQSPSTSILESMKPFLNAIVKPELLTHQDRDVKLLVATCVCEITRITAPEAPYSDDVLKDIFQLIVGTFGGLSDTNGPSFGRRVVILETLAKYRSCVVMLDLECDDLVNEMFGTFLSVARDYHPESVLSSMQKIMVVLLEESEDVQEDLLSTIFSALGRNKNDIAMAARRLAMNVIQQCAAKLEISIKQFLLSSMSGDSKSLNNQIQYHEVIYDLYCCAPQILSGVAPYLTGELLTDQLETRLKAVNLVGDIFSLPGSAIIEAFQPIFAEFLKRLTDRDVGVRMSVLEHVKSCLLSNPFRPEAPQIISALCDRLLDYDENVRKQVVAVICDVACRELNAISLETVKLVAERLRDKSLLVKKYAMERLGEIYRVYCEKSSDSSINPNEYEWLPGKILRCLYDRDFRLDIIESLLSESLFPAQFSVEDKVKHWVGIFSRFDKVEVKALEKILEQKQRLQQEMQRYLSLRHMNQEKDVPEVQKKIQFCFRVMSRSFADPIKAEENFQILDQLKDANIWKILTNLVDPNTGCNQTHTLRVDLLNILGEKHRLYDFLNTFSLKCSHLLFNKEHVKAILLETSIQKAAGNGQSTLSCMNLLVILACFSPLLLVGSEEELVNLLKDDDDIIKEGVLHVLAMAGATIREQLAVSSSSIDLMLERSCLEGSRRQAKYAVHALASITKDDGLKSLSVLYKRLVDMLEERTHLPAVLQSLGCIAQTAMPIFETRENEIEEFIINKILKCHSKPGDTKLSWDDRSDLCMLKIYGIKTLVKSYLPVKDAHIRPGIDGLLDIIKNILSFGEISKDVESSSVDKVHLRLASAKAVLRMSRQWDHKIPIDIFHLTLRTSEIGFPQVKKILLSKIYQYIKDRLLDGKYACAFLINIFGSKQDEFAEHKQDLADIILMHHQHKARQLSLQSDANSSTAFPECILPYLVHMLAHSSCPNVDDCKDVKAFDHIYRQLHLVLSMLMHRDEDVKSEETVNKEEESISAIISIFQSIKNSEDIVDRTKSKNSHAISDLGLSITKFLVQKEVDLQGLTQSVSLPSMLYKAYEKKEGDDSMGSEGENWLTDESALAHFESLELEPVLSESAEGKVLKDNEKEGNDLPLKNMIKSIKSQGTKRKKVKRNKSVPAENKKAENDVDILKMVREINLNNLRMSPKFEANNGHEYSPKKNTKLDSVGTSIRKRKAAEETPVPVPKRRRSSFSHSGLRSPSSNSKSSQGVSEDDFLQVKKKRLKSAESDLLVFSLKQKAKGSNRGHNVEGNKVGDANKCDLVEPDVLIETDKSISSNVKSSTDPIRKRKRKSIARLAKCTSKEGQIDIADLIGCRIKIWWPMDKEFYEGTVKSYDPVKRKHVILYDDGDVEILRLEKERWELVDKGRRATKNLKSSKSPSTLEKSSGLRNKNSSGSKHKKPAKTVNGKRTPKKSVKRGQKGASRIRFLEGVGKESSEISNLEEAVTSKVGEMNSGDSEGEQSEKLNDILIDDEDSGKKADTCFQRKAAKEYREAPESYGRIR
ncbi:sister chromatid cohesion protein PDS5-like A-A-like [Quillaja saponaria]|uniref:Sister chromatid cohesion protein PDS5-like A-A-like n=1 Tax=Quillaja saponaria TaxID=32244 RepID=A0AAD7M2I4_QUISA|nr:sister chromatid cohesion protein PDS5-like A-A-like [Quillaja saponaria]